MEESNSNVLAAALRDNTLDIAFLRPSAISEEGLRFRLLAEEAMVAAVPASHDLAVHAREGLALADMADEPFILTPRQLGPSLYDTIVEACRQAGFTPKAGQPAPQIASVLSLVAAESGVALVPASMRDAMNHAVVFLDLLAPAPVAALALATRRGDRSPAVSAFLELVASRPLEASA
ncbi:LysR substrate-binding domain-containing protein [Brevundimonas sp.]